MGYHRVDAFPAYVASSNGIKKEIKNLPPLMAVPLIILSHFFTIRGATSGSQAGFAFKDKPNDGSAVGGSSDNKTIANRFFKSFYLKRGGVEKRYNNVTPIDFAIKYAFQHGRYMWATFLKDGDAIPAFNATALNARMDFIFDFTHDAFETPDKFVTGSEELSLDGACEVSYDTDGSSLTTVALGNGNADLVNVKQVLGVELEPVPYPIVGPPWEFRADQEPTENNERAGPFIELANYETALPSTLDAALTTISIKRGTRLIHNQATPGQLADSYARGAVPLDGVAPFAIERNCSPLVWMEARKKLEERQLPIVISKRNINFQGSSASRTLRQHRILSQKEHAEIIASVMSQYPKVKGSWENLPVRYKSRDPAIDRLFGTRVLMPGKW